jgi:hypothetical protein
VLHYAITLETTNNVLYCDGMCEASSLESVQDRTNRLAARLPTVYPPSTFSPKMIAWRRGVIPRDRLTTPDRCLRSHSSARSISIAGNDEGN